TTLSAMLSVRSGALSWQRQNTYPAIAAPRVETSRRASAADHSHPRRRWLEQTVLICGRTMGFRTLPRPAQGRVAANLLIFPAGILSAHGRLTRLVECKTRVL
ncbi:MAG: hypothetical protein ABWZ93_14190, partial [Xanthobacteraceae bacterium]